MVVLRVVPTDSVCGGAADESGDAKAGASDDSTLAPKSGHPTEATVEDLPVEFKFSLPDGQPVVESFT